MPCMKAGPSLEERFEGCLLGLAVGDALGYSTEFLTLDQIRQRFGPTGIQDLQGTPARHSDDTQMSMAVAKALIEVGDKPLDVFMSALSREFLVWLRSPDNDRAPGNTSIKGCQSLEGEVPWTHSGIPESKGCGSNMRVAPIGLFYYDQPQRLRQVARASALITHGHPTALIAAEVTAFCVAWAVQGISPQEFLERMRSLQQESVCSWDADLGDIWKRSNFESAEAYVRQGWTELLAATARITPCMAANSADVCESLGGGWTAEEALACSLVCVLRHPTDFPEVVRQGANSSGDSDSIACIAGSFSGAWLGSAAIPKDWRKRVESRQALVQLAKALLEARSRHQDSR
ncbi:MAG: ADP-ribosylglycohydrolase family protein [Acidobacteriota bacterium]